MRERLAEIITLIFACSFYLWIAYIAYKIGMVR